MQMNEHVGQVQQGTRPPAIEQALDDTRATSIWRWLLTGS